MGERFLVWLYSEFLLGALYMAAPAGSECYTGAAADLSYVIAAGFRGCVHGYAGVCAWYLAFAHGLQVSGASALVADLVPGGALFMLAMWLPAPSSALIPCVAVAFPGVRCQSLVFDIGLGHLVCHILHTRLALAFELDDVQS